MDTNSPPSIQPQASSTPATRNPQGNAPSDLQPQAGQLQNASESGASVMRALEQQGGDIKVERASGPSLTSAKTQAATAVASPAKRPSSQQLIYVGMGVLAALFVVALWYGLFRERPYKPAP